MVDRNPDGDFGTRVERRKPIGPRRLVGSTVYGFRAGRSGQCGVLSDKGSPYMGIQSRRLYQSCIYAEDRNALAHLMSQKEPRHLGVIIPHTTPSSVASISSPLL